MLQRRWRTGGSPGNTAIGWWSLVLDRQCKVSTIRNGSCGDALTTADVPRIIRALTELDLLTNDTMIAVDDGRAVIVGLMK